ncbi:MAG: response regulator [Geobacteraceae bacterium]|nr:response regulator [Geobacteraceae bacterium]
MQVHDTGIGMDDAEVERLFQPFSQADESTSRRYGGTGLGLAITKRLVEMFDGTIKVTSRKDEGSCFAVNLPVALCATPGISAPMQLQSKDIYTFELEQNQKNMLCRALKPWHTRAQEIGPEMSPQKCALLLCPESAVAELPPPWHQVPRLAFVQGRQDIPRSLRNDLLPEPVEAQQIRRRIQRKLQSAKSSSAQSAMPQTQMPLQDYTIMLVEDNAINRMIAEKILERMGATIIIAKDGEHALKQMEQHPGIEAILMDIQMPGMDGYTACARLREEPYTFRGPIIALTAHAMSDEPQRCREAGMDAHVAKPFEPEQLLEVLLSHLHSNTGEPPPPAEPETPHEVEESRDDANHCWSATQGLQRINNDIELFNLLLERFLTQFCVQESSQWKEFLSWSKAEQCAWMHNLKGVAANLGADPLARQARELEERLKKAPTTKVEPENFTQLYTLLHDCCTRMRTWLSEQNATSEGQSAGDASAEPIERARLNEAVAQLLTLLAEHDLDALEMWKMIRGPLGEDLPDFIGRINTYMKNLEFEMASRHLKHWLSKQPAAEEANSPLRILPHIKDTDREC